MLRKSLAFMCVPLLITGAALAGPPVSEPSNPPAAKPADAPDTAAKLNQAFSVLHAVNQHATELSKMAEKRAKSDLVKTYAGTMVSANAKADEKLMSIAKKGGIKVVPLDAKTEEGKSILDRMKAEKTLLSSLSGDAWDKEYMILVTSHQQSVIRLLEVHKEAAKDSEVKQFIGEMATMIQTRLESSQDIMAKVYGDKV